MDAPAGPFFKTVSSAALCRVSLEGASGGLTQAQTDIAPSGGQ